MKSVIPSKNIKSQNLPATSPHPLYITEPKKVGAELEFVADYGFRIREAINNLGEEQLFKDLKDLISKSHEESQYNLFEVCTKALPVEKLLNSIKTLRTKITDLCASFKTKATFKSSKKLDRDSQPSMHLNFSLLDKSNNSILFSKEKRGLNSLGNYILANFMKDQEEASIIFASDQDSYLRLSSNSFQDNSGITTFRPVRIAFANVNNLEEKASYASTNIRVDDIFLSEEDYKIEFKTPDHSGFDELKLLFIVSSVLKSLKELSSHGLLDKNNNKVPENLSTQVAETLKKYFIRNSLNTLRHFNTPEHN